MSCLVCQDLSHWREASFNVNAIWEIRPHFSLKIPKWLVLSHFTNTLNIKNNLTYGKDIRDYMVKKED